MPYTLVQFCVEVIRLTGRKDLLNTKRKIEQQEKELLAWVDDVPGVEKAQQALQDDEMELKKELTPKMKIWPLKLKKLDLLGKAGNVDFDIAEAEIRKWESEIYQLAGKPAPPPQQPTKIDAVLKDIHNDHIKTIQALIEQLRNPLKGYRCARVIAFIVPKLLYLVFTLVILAIGASLLVEQLEGLPLKLGFAIAVWALQEFVITPRAEKQLHHFKRKKLKEFISRFSQLKIWAAFAAVAVEHQLQEKPSPKGE